MQRSLRSRTNDRHSERAASHFLSSCPLQTLPPRCHSSTPPNTSKSHAGGVGLLQRPRQKEQNPQDEGLKYTLHRLHGSSPHHDLIWPEAQLQEGQGRPVLASVRTCSAQGSQLVGRADQRESGQFPRKHIRSAPGFCFFVVVLRERGGQILEKKM